ncbi:MOSC domain-containing protein [Candidatus Poribacteria bacterium]|nr:MOSC domain-containing protein [Candidatus Poribacteria bacterium]
MAGVVVGIFASNQGGIRKPALESARAVIDHGLEGDASARHKRTPGRALCLYSAELYESLRADGIELDAGDLAENLLLSGIDFGRLSVGDRLQVGESVTIELSEVRVPCATLAPLDGRLPQALVGRSGFLAFVRSEGSIRVGDAVRQM